MNLEIRLLNKIDAIEYRDLRLHSYKKSPLAFSESFEDENHKPIEEFELELMIQGTPPECFVLGAFTETKQLVGFVKFRRDSRSKARHKSMIHAMYTHPNYRKNQIGIKLIFNLLTRVNKLEGLEQIHLWVLHSGTSASGFYKKCGFKNQGPIVKKDLKIGNTYVDAEYMVMHLNNK